MLGQDGEEAVAEAATVIAPTGPHEYGRTPDHTAFTLDYRPEELRDGYGLFSGSGPHGRRSGRYSAHVFCVSLTLTAATSGHKELAKS